EGLPAARSLLARGADPQGAESGGRSLLHRRRARAGPRGPGGPGGADGPAATHGGGRRLMAQKTVTIPVTRNPEMGPGGRLVPSPLMPFEVENPDLGSERMLINIDPQRSEELRVGKECGCVRLTLLLHTAN